MSTWLMACLLAGSGLRALTGGDKRLQLLPIYGAILAGLFVGQLIAWAINRDRIEWK